MDKMKIEIWSDIACPYCYIGKRKMDKALSELSFADEIELIWHSYVLDPDLPKGNYGKSIYKYMAESQGKTEEEVRKSHESVLSLAKEQGLNYNFDKLVVTNTVDALRLVKLANKYDQATQAEEALFEAYFCDGEDISDLNTLIFIGTKIGIPDGDTLRCLSSFEYSEEIQNDVYRADEELKLDYIPYYLLNNKFTLQGSVPVSEYVDIIRKAYDDWKINGVSDGTSKTDIVGGKSCSIDGTCSI